MSRYSISSRSPGSAPLTYTGPVSGWATLRSSFSRSLAVERGPICRSLASRVSSATSSPGSTSMIRAMSGCQRWWPVCGSSRRRFARSMRTVLVMGRIVPMTPNSVLSTEFNNYGRCPELSGLALGVLGQQLHLHPALLAPVEGLIGLDRVGERLGLREDHGRIDHAGRDEVDELRQVFAVRRVAGLDGEVLLHRLADREQAAFGIDADDRQRPGLGEALHRPLEHLRGRIARAPLSSACVRLRSHLLQLPPEFGALLLGLLRRRPGTRRHRVDADCI